MKIKKVSIENFRGFYGKVDLNFSIDDKKPVTLILAQNGVCKTTILAAILWCFTEKKPKSMNKKDNLVNTLSIARHQNNISSVTINFIHDGQEFLCKRSIRRKEKKSFEFYVNKIDEFGAIGDEVDHRIIEEIIPQSMAEYFFFDGEHSVRMIDDDNQKAIHQTIRNVIGCAIAERAIEDLNSIINDLNKQQIAISGKNSDTEIQELSETLSGYPATFKLLNEKKRRLQDEKSVAKRNLKKIKDYLSGVDELEKANERIEEINLLLKKPKEDLKKSNEQYNKWFSSNELHSLLLHETSKKVYANIQKSENAGLLPAKVTERLIEDLCARGYCLCGNKEIGDKKSKAWTNLQKEKILATSDDTYNAFQLVKQTSYNLQKNDENDIEVYEQIQKNILADQDAINKLEEEKRILIKKESALVSKEIAEARIKEGELTESLEGENNFDIRIGEVQNQINSREREKEKIEEQKNRAIKGKDAYIPFQNKEIFANLLIDDIQKRMNEHEDKTRLDLSKIIEKKLKENWRGDFTFSFNEDFSLDIEENEHIQEEEFFDDLDEEEKQLPTSEGQSSLIAQTFISQLLKYSKENKGKSDFFITGINAPLIIDSPFGKLDTHYRTTAAKNVAESVDQAIYLVSTSQAPEEVVNEIDNKIGKVILCTQELMGSKADELKKNKKMDPTDFVFKGKNYKSFIYDQDTVKITIKELN